MVTIQANDLQPLEASAMDPVKLDSYPIRMLKHSSYSAVCPRTSVYHGNQQEVTEDQ